MHFDLKDVAFQDSEEEIVLTNGSNVKTGSGSEDVLELTCILPMKPYLSVVTGFLLAHHDNLFPKVSKGNYAELIPENIVWDNSKQKVVP